MPPIPRNDRLIERRYSPSLRWGQVTKNRLSERVRAVADVLKRFNDPATAALTLATCVQARPWIGRILYENFAQNVQEQTQQQQKGRQRTLPQYPPETELVLMLEHVYETKHHLREYHYAAKNSPPTLSVRRKSSRGAASSQNEVESMDGSLPSYPMGYRPSGTPTQSCKPTLTTVHKSTTAIVSDSETLCDEEHAQNEASQRALAHAEFWSNLYEHVLLCITSLRLPTRGRRMTFTIGQLSEPVSSHLPLTICSRMQDELVSAFEMSTPACRVYMVPCACSNFVWIQCHLGAPIDPVETKSTKTKPNKTVTVVLQPESNLIAIATSGQGIKKCHMECVVEALEQTLTSSKRRGSFVESDATSRFQHVRGADPYTLLETAHHLDSNQAAGRLATCAADGSAWCASEQFQTGATSSHCDLIAMLPRDTSVTGVEAAANANEDTQAHDARTKRRSREHDLGRDDCKLPVRTVVQWDWSGATSAVSDLVPSKRKKLKFQTTVTMKGSNVLEGMKALVDAGILNSPLPTFIKDAAVLGEGGSIRCGPGSN